MAQTHNPSPLETEAGRPQENVCTAEAAEGEAVATKTDRQKQTKTKT